MRTLIKMKHKFHSKDIEDGSWMIWCPVTRGSFSTKLWKGGVISSQECACCGGNVKEEVHVKSDQQLREENNKKFEVESITTKFQRPLDFYVDGAK